MARFSWSGRKQEPHLTTEALLLLLDGQLDSSKRTAAERHLRDCWECRALQDRIESTVTAIIEERRDDLSAHSAGSENDRARFTTRLARLAAQKPVSQSEWPWQRWVRLTPRALWPLLAAAAALAATTQAWVPPVQNFIAKLAAPSDQMATVALVLPRPPAVPPAALVVMPPHLPPAPRVDLPSAPLTIAAIPQALAPALPTPAELDAAELEAYLALHQLGLCRTSGFQILRLPPHTVRIAGITEDDTLAASLREALSTASARIEVAVTAPPATLPPPTDFLPVTQPLQAQPPLLEARLKEFFQRQSPPERAGREMADYSNLAIRLASIQSTEAQALRTLASIFTTARIHQMDSHLRSRLARAALDHIHEIEQSRNNLHQHLDRIASEVSPIPPAEAIPPDSWEQAAASLGRDAARIDYLAAGLFGGLDLQGTTESAAWAEFRTLIEHCQTYLAAAAEIVQSGWARPNQTQHQNPPAVIRR